MKTPNIVKANPNICRVLSGSWNITEPINIINKVFECPIILYATADKFPITQKTLKLTKNATIPQRNISKIISKFINSSKPLNGSRNGTTHKSNKPESGAW